MISEEYIGYKLWKIEFEKDLQKLSKVVSMESQRLDGNFVK